MFDRILYKNVARKQLKGRSLTPMLATAVQLVIIYAVSLPYKNYVKAQVMKTLGNEVTAESMQSAFSSLIFILALMGILYIASSYLYITLSHTKEKQPFSTYIKGFSLYLKGFLGFVWFYIWTFLWTLLLIVPGIVKSISYSQMFFILAEYPELGVRKAMNISKTITKGFKADLFVMFLSFLGWIILTGITYGILGVWLIPYMSMSFVNAYHAIKDNAIKSGIISLQDFGVSTNTNTNVIQEQNATETEIITTSSNVDTDLEEV